MNNYHKDSKVFFREVSKAINEDLDKSQVIQLAMNLALGCERLLKGILFDVNPTYILNEPAFKNSIQVLYADKLLLGSKGSKELLAKPNSDVITFKNSLLRAQLISETTEKHKNILFAISDARDIIAHCDLKLLDVRLIKDIIQRDFFTMLRSYSTEFGVGSDLYFEGHHDRLAKISISKQTDLTTKIELIVERHKAIWDQHKTDDGYVKKQLRLTEVLLRPKNKGKTTCPACSQDAIVFLRPVVEVDPFLNEKIIIGNEIDGLHCMFCKLKENAPSMLDIWGIKYNTITRPCIGCGQEMTSNASGICSDCENESHSQLGLF